MTKYVLGNLTFGLVCTMTLRAQLPARDVAGVTLGMPLAEAVTRLTAYGTLPGWRVDQFKWQSPALPGETYVVGVRAENHSRGTDVMGESIELEFAPAPPPAQPIVTRMYRHVSYVAGHERETNTVVNAFKERYGTTPFRSNPEISSMIGLWWYYDATGKPIARQAACDPAAGAKSEGIWQGPQSQDSRFLETLAERATKCGTYAVVGTNNLTDPKLVSGVDVAVVDSKTRAERFQSMDAYMKSAAARQGKNAVDAAAKRKPPR